MTVKLISRKYTDTAMVKKEKKNAKLIVHKTHYGKLRTGQTNPVKNGGDLRFSGIVSRFCSTGDNPVIHRKVVFGKGNVIYLRQ